MQEKKSVIVTGSSGFIGREVTRQLLSKGYQVIGIGLQEDTENFKGSFDYIQTDLREPASQTIFQKAPFCIHLAAQIGGVKYMDSYPAGILNDNIKILANTFEGAVKAKVQRLVYASSSMIFQLAKQYPSTEDQVPKIPPPSNFYGFSKLVGEYYCRAYQHEFGLPYTIIRIFNAYGANEYLGERGHVLPDLVQRILQGEYPLQLHGHPEASRPFTHVSDVAAAFVLVLENRKAQNEDFNVGTENEIKIHDLAKLLWKLCRRTESFKAVWTGKVTDTAVRRGVDPQKIKNIGWQPQISLEEGGSEVISWLKKVNEKNTQQKA